MDAARAPVGSGCVLEQEPVVDEGCRDADLEPNLRGNVEKKFSEASVRNVVQVLKSKTESVDFRRAMSAYLVSPAK